MALLHDLSRLHFTLESTASRPLANNQLASGGHFQTPQSDLHTAYAVRVKFNSETQGFFSQRVTFDFGFRPVVGRTLSVNMHGTTQDRDRVVGLQQELQLQRRWTNDNCTIVAFDETKTAAVFAAAAAADDDDGDDLDARLLERYRQPSDVNEIINTGLINNELNRHNYTHRMHGLLTLEECTQAKIISRLACYSFGYRK